MNRFNTTKSGYKYDRLIFNSMLFVWLLVFSLVAYDNGFNFKHHLYFKCSGVEPCPNPYLDIECNRKWLLGDDCNVDCTEEWCNLAMLPPGEFGEKPPRYFKYIPPLVVVSLLLSLLLNHFLHNRGRSFDVEVKITNNKRFSLLDMEKIRGLEDDEKD